MKDAEDSLQQAPRIFIFSEPCSAFSAFSAFSAVNDYDCPVREKSSYIEAFFRFRL